MKHANIFQLPRRKRLDEKPKQQPKKEVDPLPWGEGEPELPQPPFLPAA